MGTHRGWHSLIGFLLPLCAAAGCRGNRQTTDKKPDAAPQAAPAKPPPESPNQSANLTVPPAPADAGAAAIVRVARAHGSGLMGKAQSECGVAVDCRHALCRRWCQAFVTKQDAASVPNNTRTSALLGCIAGCAQPSDAGP